MVKKRFLKTAMFFCVAAMLLSLFSACATATSETSADVTKVVEAGTSWKVSETIELSELTIAKGANVEAPEGYDIVMTDDGVQTPVEPGGYEGDIVLSVVGENLIVYEPGMGGEPIHHFFQQALYVDESGIVEDKSVLPAVVGGSATDKATRNIEIRSVGECFNGIYAGGGIYTVEDPVIDFTGNGGNDFAGYGAAVMSAGKETTLVIDGADIDTRGAVRTACVADKGSTLIVKNSEIRTMDGALPEDYKPTIELGVMKEVPWMLGLVGNCRATNLLGENTTATYINSSIAAEGWGVLSTDACQNVTLTAINSDIVITGESGYGAYAIGNAKENFYGCDFDVADYAVINRGGHVVFGASSPEKTAQLNKELDLGLTEKEIASLDERETTVHSDRFGLMWHGDGSTEIADGTSFTCKKTIFLTKGAAAHIDVDGSKGALLESGNGVILQLMDDDDPGPAMVDGRMLNVGVYKEPAGPVSPDESHDIYTADETDTLATFAHMELNGDFYNSTRGGSGGATGPGGEPGGPGNSPAGPDDSPAGPGGMGGGSKSKNLSLTFDDTRITGVISASTAKHAVDTITAEEYMYLGEVANTPDESVNNGVLVSLVNGSTWTVTGTSYLTSLNIDAGSHVQAPAGSELIMTVDGVRKAIEAGTYKGAIVLNLK